MTGHDAADSAAPDEGVGGVYRPWTPGSADRPFDDVDGWVDERDPFTRVASEQDREPGVRLRRAPSGMGRRDRREWKMLEAARVHRLRTDELRSAPEGSFRPGFVTSPPKYLDRRSRRAWLAIERESSKSWWEHRRSWTRDVGNRERGALAVALVAGGLLSWWVIAGWLHHPAATAPPAVSSTTSAGSLPAAAPPVSAAAAAVPVPSSAPVAGPVNPVSTAAASRPGPAGEPGQLGTLDHGWSPTPAGGVPAIPAPPAATPINPASVHLIARPTGRVGAADTADPKAAVSAWAARMCPQRWTDTFLADRAAVKPLMTTSGWADEIGNPQEQDYWAFAADRKQETRCAAVTVTVSPDQPTGGGLAYVLYRGLRVVTIGAPAGGRSAPVVTVMSGVRTVLRQPDGRWLVDVAAPSGG